jgi:hypothetical protein
MKDCHVMPGNCRADRRMKDSSAYLIIVSRYRGIMTFVLLPFISNMFFFHSS